MQTSQAAPSQPTAPEPLPPPVKAVPARQLRSTAAGVQTCLTVYGAIASHCFGEPEAWPSQKTLESMTGLGRQAVNRAVRDLVAGGWLVVTKPRYPGSTWQHNRYELMTDFTGLIDSSAARAITRRAHRRKALADAFVGSSVEEGDTNTYGVRIRASRPCSCGVCRPAPTQRGIVWPDDESERDDWRYAEARRIREAGREAVRSARQDESHGLDPDRPNRVDRC